MLLFVVALLLRAARLLICTVRDCAELAELKDLFVVSLGRAGKLSMMSSNTCRAHPVLQWRDVPSNGDTSHRRHQILCVRPSPAFSPPLADRSPRDISISRCRPIHYPSST